MSDSDLIREIPLNLLYLIFFFPTANYSQELVLQCLLVTQCLSVLAAEQHARVTSQLWCYTGKTKQTQSRMCVWTVKEGFL